MADPGGPYVIPEETLAEAQYEFTQGEMDNFRKIFKEDSSAILAQSLTSIAQNISPEFSYRKLKNGSSLYFDQDYHGDAFKGSPTERRFSDDDIISLLSNAEKVGFFEAAAKKAPTAVATTGAFGYGFGTGVKVQQYIPPVNLPAMVLKSAIPPIFGAAASVATNIFGEKVAEPALGLDTIATPDSVTRKLMGEVFAYGASGPILNFMAKGKEINLDAASYVSSLLPYAAKTKLGEMVTGATGFIEPSGRYTLLGAKYLGASADELSRLKKNRKIPTTVKLLSAIEKFYNGVGKDLTNKSVSGQVANILGEVALSGSAALGAGSAQTVIPDSNAAQFGGEFAGAAVPAVFAKRFADLGPKLANVVKNSYTAIKEQGILAATGRGAKVVFGEAQEKRKLSSAKFILNKLKKAGYDDEQINLIIEELDQVLTPEDMKKFVDLEGNIIQPTAGLISSNPIIKSLENSIATRLGGEFGQDQLQMFNKLNSSLKAQVESLVLLGDREALDLAGELQKTRFELLLSNDQIGAINNMMVALDQVKKTDSMFAGDNIELSTRLNDVIQGSIDKARELEREFWNAIPNFDLDVDDLNSLEFIQFFNSGAPNTKEFKAEFLNKNPVIGSFIKRKLKEFGVVDPLEEIVTPSDTFKVDPQIKRVEDDIETQFGEKIKSDYDLILNAIGLRNESAGELFTGVGGVFPSGSVPQNILDIADPAERVLEAIKLQEKKLKGRAGDKVRLNELLEVKKYASKLSQLERIKKLDKTKKETFETELLEETPEEPPKITFQELREARTSLLKKARTLLAQGDRAEAAFNFKLASKILNDLDNVAPDDTIEYNNARAFSAAFNDFFTRTFVGDIKQKSKNGGFVMIPELLAKNLQMGGTDPTYMRVKQITDVGNFLRDQDIEGAENISSTISGTLEMILRNARSSAFDKSKVTKLPNGEEIVVEGAFNPQKLQKWLEDNKKLLTPDNENNYAGFPSIQQDIQAVIDGNISYEKVLGKNKNRLKKAFEAMSFMRLTDDRESATSLVTQALASGNKHPIKSLKQLRNIARGARGPNGERSEAAVSEAMSGLRSSILEYAMEKASAGAGRGKFDASKMKAILFESLPNAVLPPKSGTFKTAGEFITGPKIGAKTTLSEQMVQLGISTSDEINNVRNALNEIEKLQITAASPGGLADLTNDPNALFDFYLRIAGSAVGTRLQKLVVPGGTGAGSLVAAGAGSKFFREFWNANMPSNLEMDVMAQLMKDPQMLALMLKKAKDPAKAKPIITAIKQLMVEVGLIPAKVSTRFAPAEISDTLQKEDLDKSLEESEILPKEFYKRITGEGALDVSSLNKPPPPEMISPSLASASPIQPITGLGANQNQRSKLAAAFPFDITSDIDRMKKAGIGSLMG
tara:strand:- start:5136 stop:9302 length:4167 start_codon:yes stop_codon:yes gene_type:complete